MLRKALAALQQACDASRDEIFVVDNGSNDGSPDDVATQWPHVHLIRNHCNNGFARANNQAIRKAQGEYVLLLNSDAVMAPDVLNRFEEDFRRLPAVGAITGELRDDHGNLQRSGGPLPTALTEIGLGFLRPAKPMPESDGLRYAEIIVGACMAVRRTAIDMAGSLDNDFFFYGEDIEWCYRLGRHGWRIAIDPAARIVHIKGGATRGKRRGAQIEMLRARLQFYTKTMTPAVAFGVTAFRVVRLFLNVLVNSTAALMTLGLLRSTREKAAIYILQMAWLIAGRPEHWGLPDKCPREPDPE